MRVDERDNGNEGRGNDQRGNQSNYRYDAGKPVSGRNSSGKRGSGKELDLNVRWEAIRARLKIELGTEIYESWFTSIEADSINNGTLFLSVPTKFLKNWITEHYRQCILAHWKDDPAEVRSVEVVLRQPKAHKAAEPKAIEASATGAIGRDMRSGVERMPAAGDPIGSPLDPRLSFQTFRTNQSNALAQAAARQLAGAEAGDPVQFNPFYVHSAVGRGKTHLLQAIAAHLSANHPDRRAIYMTAERFMYRFASSLDNNQILSFKDILRSADVLIIDDMQFLQGRNTQQEFSHTLNSLLDGCRQVVVAADRPPADLDGLDERVRSRLAGGLTVEIGAPEHELRVEILRTRCEMISAKFPGFVIPDEAIDSIAGLVKTNGRDLEGVINRLVAHNQFGKVPITLELAEKTVRGHIRPEEPRRIRIEDIQRAVAQHFNVSKSDLLSARRNRSIVRPRQIAMYLSKQMTPRSLPEIGRRFGGRDHTTVLHAVRKIEELMAADIALARDVDHLMQFFQSGN